ncbi:thioredoxin-like protein [Apodospora peruviana]|uniref:Thioredoxin-like protein n=1 Tax=Apodospora peruviana TaxID=516989 RepID=A0AAE0I7M0_9PEZI|nr:thioredoxin-like protein [Apodospora peruviana]KAK3319146.1 thioredoxin-like protein [Apodospora peruviana]
MTVHNIETVSQFKETIAKNKVVLLDAFAVWCGPCKAIAPQIAKWSESEEFKDKIYFAKFDVDHLPDLAQDLGVRAMPTFFVFKDGDKVDDFLGANPPALLNLLKKNTPAEATIENTSQATDDSHPTATLPRTDESTKE